MTHLTAISRTKLSAPMKWLRDQGLLQWQVLDYGCGRGQDAKTLKIASYDPYYQPKMPHHKFHTITCIYVLNVISSPVVRAYTLGCMIGMLSCEGTLYVAVRSDIKRDHFTVKGWQGNIDVIAETKGMNDLDVSLIRKTSGYRLYRIRKT